MAFLRNVFSNPIYDRRKTAKREFSDAFPVISPAASRGFSKKTGKFPWRSSEDP
jgi:hypothetical protein